MESPPNSMGVRGWSSKLATSELLREFGRTFTSALLAVGCLAAPALYAADCSKPREAKGTVSNSFATAVQQAAGQIEKKDYGTAISALTKMAQSDVSAYEKAVAYYNLGYAYSAKGDNKNAATAFKQALDQDAMPQKQYEQLLYNTGQLFVANGDYAQGTRLLERYLADTCSPISPDVYIFLASAYSEQKQFAKALPYVDQAIAKSPKPK
jgi:tetratricopeptide (TPR) repeat protein